MGITITASTKLSQDEKDRMVSEAEQFAEQDRLAKEETEARNMADSLIYTTEKTLTEIGDKLTDEQKTKIQNSVEALKETLKTGGTAEINAKIEELRNVVQEAGAAVYQQAAAQQAQQQAAQQPPPPEGGEQQQEKKTVEAEYKVVDEEEEKKR